MTRCWIDVPSVHLFLLLLKDWFLFSVVNETDHLDFRLIGRIWFEF